MTDKVMIAGEMVERVPAPPTAGKTKVPDEAMDAEQREALKDVPRAGATPSKAEPSEVEPSEEEPSKAESPKKEKPKK